MCSRDCITAARLLVNEIESSWSSTASRGMLFDTLKSSIIQKFSINHPQPCPERRDGRVGALDPFNGNDTESAGIFLSSGASGHLNFGFLSLFVVLPHLPNDAAVFPQKSL